MLMNLKAEMVRNGVTNEDISKVLGLRISTVSEKINGKYRFYFEEAFKIRNHFFPKCSLEYLFLPSTKNSA